MTDADAKAIAEMMLKACAHPDCTQCHMLRHALQAIEDRERLAGAAAYALRILPPEYADWRAALEQSVEAARRHMEGK